MVYIRAMVQTKKETLDNAVQESTRREVEVDYEEAEKDDDRGTPEEQLEDSDNDAWSTPERRVTPGRRVSQRENKGVPPRRLVYKAQTVSVHKPKTWEKVLTLPTCKRQVWITATQEEIRSLEKRQVWEFTKLHTSN